jgi:hypothetical protein
MAAFGFDQCGTEPIRIESTPNEKRKKNRGQVLEKK